MRTSPISRSIFAMYNNCFFYSHHQRYVGRTVLVNNGKAEEALRVVNKIMGNEGLLDLWRRTRSYEKPFNTRRRLNWEKSKAIYDEDMRRKINFVMRSNRVDPWIAM